MTHADTEPASKTSDLDLLEQLMKQYSVYIILEQHIFRLDAFQAMGAEMKLLRQTIANTKKHIVEVCAAWRRVQSERNKRNWNELNLNETKQNNRTMLFHFSLTFTSDIFQRFSLVWLINEIMPQNVSAACIS